MRDTQCANSPPLIKNIASTAMRAPAGDASTCSECVFKSSPGVRCVEEIFTTEIRRARRKTNIIFSPCFSVSPWFNFFLWPSRPDDQCQQRVQNLQRLQVVMRLSIRHIVAVEQGRLAVRVHLQVIAVVVPARVHLLRG